MLKFAFFDNDEPPVCLQGAYLVGADGVAVRGEVTLERGHIRCHTRSNEPLGLSLLWRVGGFGVVQLQTTRLPQRGEPYHLHLELVRHRLLCITLKREEWGLFDYPGMEETVSEIDAARGLFVEALERIDEPREAARLADEALSKAMWSSERMCRFHASVFLARRRQAGFARNFLSVAVPASTEKVGLARRLAESFDSVRVPFLWREVQPDEQRTHYDATDAWVKACTSAKMAIRGGPLLNFGVQFVPDWMYIWEHDYEAIFEFAREHIRRTVQRYADHVTSWTVASGLHGENVFSFNFEQIMELTRMAGAVTRESAPGAQIVLDLVQPWGEYYARNPRTVPPLLYADMVMQSGITFDAFGLQFLFGLPTPGYHLRDMFQISTIIDRLANLGKPIHVTALAVPSVRAENANGGQWHGEWTDATQAEWLAVFSEIALSKPYVESVCIHTLVDGLADGINHAGLLRNDLTPKPAFARLAELRKELLTAAPKS